MDWRSTFNQKIELWPIIRCLVKFWQSLPKCKIPSSKSYEVVVEPVADSLVVANLHFLSLLKPYLKKFQSEQPMIPYLKKEFLLLCRNVLEIIIQADILSNLTGLQLTKIDLSNRKVFLKRKDKHLWFAAECEIKDLLKKDLVSINDVKEIKDDAVQLIIALMKNIFERCPLGADVFDPNYLLNESSASLKTKVQKLLYHLIH